MHFQPFRSLAILALVFAATAASRSVANAGDAACPTCLPQRYVTPDLFYNYYVAPNCDGVVGAQMYMSPIPVPAHVGHTYNTYQPLMPHELMYRHKHTYHHHYNYNRGLTRTRVIYW